VKSFHCDLLRVSLKKSVDKYRKYDFLDNYNFQPVAIETTGLFGKCTAPFLSCLAKKLVEMSGYPRE